MITHENMVKNDKHKAVVWFTSDSRAFLETFGVFEARLPVIYWVGRCGRCRLTNTTGQTLLLVLHAPIDSCTTSRGVFGVCGLQIKVADDPLKSTSAHVIKFSERPVPCSMPVVKPHYTMDDRFCLKLLGQPVVFQSGFSRSGWDIRQLIPAELSHAFDLPSYLDWDEGFPTGLIPIQMFCVVGDAVLERLRSLREDGSGAPVQCARPASSVLPASRGRDPPTWLVGIGRWLPETWSDAEIASKAVSKDNANVDYRPWNLFTSVFPLTSPSVIRDFEVLGLRRWRHVLSRSFFASSGPLRTQVGRAIGIGARSLARWLSETLSATS